MSTYQHQLKTLLKSVMPIEQAEHFFNYEISAAETKLITDTARAVLDLTPSQGFNCAAMSAAWGAMFLAHSAMPIQVVCGHLDWGDKRIFNYIKPIPVPTQPMQEKEFWDGHCWVAIAGLIAEVSLGRTVRFGQVPILFKEHILTLLGPNAGPFSATPEQMRDMGLTYAPFALKDTQQIDGLLGGFCRRDKKNFSCADRLRSKAFDLS